MFRESNIRFRYKVMLGVGLSLAIALFSGANAIYNVRKVEESVSFSAEAASPLLIGVISLSESYQKLQSVFDPVMRNCAGLEGAARYLANSEENQKTKLETLRKLAEQAGALTELERYEFSGQKIFRTRQALLDICHANTTTRGHISSAESSIHITINVVGLGASTNLRALETRLSTLLQKKNISLPRGPLSTYVMGRQVDDEVTQAWRHIRDFYKIRVLVAELGGVGAVLSDVGREFELQSRRKSYMIKMRSFERTIAGLKPYYESIDQGGSYAGTYAMVKQTRMMLDDGPRSLFNAAYDLLQNEHTKQSLLVRLQREQGQYSVALLNIMDVAQRINRNAQLRTEHDANRANWEIAATMLLAAMLALMIGWYFNKAVTLPLEKLTGNVGKLGRALRADDKLVDESLLQRGDEIGDLAVQFSRTFQLLVNARRELQEASRAELGLQRDRLHGAIENMPQGLYMLDREGKIIVANRKLAQLYNLDGTRELVGTTVEDFIRLCHEKGAGVLRIISDDVAADTRSNGTYQTSQRVVELEDHRIMTMKVMRLPDGGYVVTHEDITDKQVASEKIAHMAMHDGLTNLANRALFRLHIDEHAESTASGDSALLFLDLDRFKIVNDTLGHPIGDALLVEAAKRVRESLPENSFAARLGGDEFAIYQTGVAQPEGAELLAADVTRRISEPFEIDGHHIVIGTSIGIALSPRDGLDADELLKNADMALYRAKQEGKGNYLFFEPDMDRKMRDWHEMEHDLREAIAGDQFELYYQPLVSLDDERILAFEALIRWHHPRRGLVSPAEFIPVAEETGLINEIGAWVLNTATEQALHWPANITVAVNVSPVQFRTGHLQLRVMAALDRSGLDPDRLLIEITEGVFLKDTEQTMTILSELQAIGVRFAMDDFGTGYSSLSYIRKFPFDKIKIDQSFVRGLSDNPESVAIIRAVTNLCKDLGMMTTAEGVETAEHAEILRGLGCETAQGYYFGRPMRAADTLKLFDAPLKFSA